MSEAKPKGRPYNIQVRLGEDGHAWLQRLRREYDLTRSDVAREAMAVAAKHEKELRARLDEIGNRF